MSDPASASAASNAAPVSSTPGAGSLAAGTPKRPVTDNPAFRAMGLPRLRLPSRNWMIFLTVTGSFASAVLYDKWQTRRNREKWCDLVSHIAHEPLSTKSLPRRLTIFLAAPPGDGLRSAREHFHDYVKPVLVAAAMDWDVVEGRKEGDVRHKTAERIRRKRKRAGEGEPLSQEEAEKLYAVDTVRERSGTTEYEGVAGDVVIGRHTWKEYVRGLHEGWLGPVDAPALPELEASANTDTAEQTSGQSAASEALIKGGTEIGGGNGASGEPTPTGEQTTPDSIPVEKEKEEKEEKKEEEKPKPRNPPPYITPSDYPTANLSPSTPEMIGPDTAVEFPHILGFRNTPIRIYRFLTRRRLADDVGRQVAAAVLASSARPYTTVTVNDDESASAEGGHRTVPEQEQLLKHEEKSWWKTVRLPRKEHEESLWIEDVVVDERLAGRMRKFELTSEDEERAKRIADGVEKVDKHDQEEES